MTGSNQEGVILLKSLIIIQFPRTAKSHKTNGSAFGILPKGNGKIGSAFGILPKGKRIMPEP